MMLVWTEVLRHPLGAALALLLVLSTAFGGWQYVRASHYEAELAKAQASISTASATAKAAQEQADQVRIAQLQAQVADTRKALEDLAKQRRTARQNLATTRKQLQQAYRHDKVANDWAHEPLPGSVRDALRTAADHSH